MPTKKLKTQRTRLTGNRSAVLALAAAGAVLFGASAASGHGDRPDHDGKKVKIQDEFDPLGPAVTPVKLSNGRTAHYADTGNTRGKPVLYVGGTGTTARALNMTEFLRSTRENLGLRLISVERNGFGDTEFDPKLNAADYARDVVEILDKLKIDKISVVAISGGGPYAAELAALVPDRIEALHLAAAAPPYGPVSETCALPDDVLAGEVKKQISDPKVWWGYPADSPVHGVPGFTDTAYEEGARAFYLRGQNADPAPEVHEMKLYCKRPGPDLSQLKAPVYLYGGNKDTTVPPSTLATWRENLPHVTRERTYDDSGHEVQYRHWDQILVDLAGMPDKTPLCVDNESRLVPESSVEGYLKRGATLGSCAWQKDKK